MFDKTIVHVPRQPASVVQHVQMVDPSIERGARFLDEVQQRAQARITEAMLIDVPGINVQLVGYSASRNMADLSDRHAIAFKINGQTVSIDVDHSDWERPEAIIKLVTDKIAETVLKQVLQASQPLVRRVFTNA